MSANKYRVKPYSGEYELNFFIDDADFWDKYLMFKQEYYRCYRTVMENSRFPRLMTEFYLTTDPVKFLELYEMLCNYVNKCPPKVWEGEEIRIDQTMTDLKSLGYVKSCELGFRNFEKPQINKFGTIVFDIPASLSEIKSVSHDDETSNPKKDRRRQIREMRIRKGQVRC